MSTGGHTEKEQIELLRELSEAFGVSGFEEEIGETIRHHVIPWAHEIHVDPIGNLHAVLNPKGKITLMLDAHMDEIGFVVQRIEEGGFLRLIPIGGWDVRVLPGQAVQIRATSGERHWGIVGSIPPHIQEADERKRSFEWNDLFVDVGAASASEVNKMKIRAGSPAVLHQSFRILGKHRVVGKALDNRAGCAVLIRALRGLFNNCPKDLRVVCTFSTTEEVGSRGAHVAARHWSPHMAMILEGTLATDTPGVRTARQVSSLGHGPVLTAVDRSLIVPERLLEGIIAMAETHRIPWQMKTPMIGSTDGGVIQRSSHGVLTAVISVPCRYIHSSGSLLHMSDLSQTSRLVGAVVQWSPDFLRFKSRPSSGVV